MEQEAKSREIEYQSNIADYEAQLVRLRSEVARISQSYQELKKKRHVISSHRKGAELGEILQCQLDQSSLNQHVLQDELQRSKDEIRELRHWKSRCICSATSHKRGRSSKQANAGLLPSNDIGHKIVGEFLSHVEMESSSLSLGIALPKETSMLLQDILDQHCQQLNQELLSMLKEH